MFSRLICLLFVGNLFSQDDGLPPSFVNIDPIEDFYSLNPIELEIIVTDRNQIDEVLLFYKFNDDTDFNVLEMQVSYQPVIYYAKIPMEEIQSGFIQYYFWSKDEYQNGSTWPIGGEDMPIVYPIFPSRQDKDDVSAQIIDEGIMKDSPKELQNNLPYYLEISMLAPFQEVKEEEGIPIIVLSVFDPEKTVNLESVRLLLDDEKVSSFNDADMITFVPQDPILPGYHIVRYESKNTLGEDLYKEFLFLVIEKEEVFDTEKESLSEKIKLKGNFGWDSNYDQTVNRPDESQKINSSLKFQLGKYKFNLYGLFNTHLDIDDRTALEFRQPVDRLKFKMNSPYLDFYYGDNSVEFSDLSLKGTRVRGISTKLKLGKWETFFVSGETKHRVDYQFSQRSRISGWDALSTYQLNDSVYFNNEVWVYKNTYSEVVQPDTSSNDEWITVESNYSNFSEISNDECDAINPALYGEILDEYDIESNLGIDISQVDIYAIWNGDNCVEVQLFSTENMLSGEDGLDNGYIFSSLETCMDQCMVPIIYFPGANKRELEGFRTTVKLLNNSKFGISLLRSRDYFDNSLIPYSKLNSLYNYEGNMVASTDFTIRFNDQTKLKGEYGLSLTLNQASPDTLILKELSDISDELNLYNEIKWNSGDYCDSVCYDLNFNNVIDTGYYSITPGIINDDSLWAIYQSNVDDLNRYAKFLSFNITDDIGAYDEGRGFSGLKSGELTNLINGGLDSIHLLFKRPTFKLKFETPIKLSFIDLNFATELNQASINFRSNGSSSIQNNLRNWKNKISFKLLKKQISFTLGYDKQIKSPWDPDNGGTIKRGLTNSYSGNIGLNFPKMPTLSYSFRFQDRKDKEIVATSDTIFNEISIKREQFSNTTNKDTLVTFSLDTEDIGYKVASTHTLTPAYKFKFGKTNINYNGSISISKDLDMLSDVDTCIAVFSNSIGEKWGGIKDTVECGDDINTFYFEESNNYPFKNSGTISTTFTNALSFSFTVPISINIGWGLSKNTPNDARKSPTTINVLSTKIGYKLLDNKLNITLGANYVLGYKPPNNLWDSGEELTIDKNGIWNTGEELTLDNDEIGVWDEGDEWIDQVPNGIWDTGEELTLDNNEIGVWDEGDEWIDEGSDGTFTPGDTFIDKVELDNYKITLKSTIQYRIPKPNITLGFNVNYTKSVNNLLDAYEQQEPILKARFSIKYGF